MIVQPKGLGLGLFPKPNLPDPSGATTKMVTSFPDPDYCPDILFPDGSRCIDYRMDTNTGQYVHDPGWWKNIRKEVEAKKLKHAKEQEGSDKNYDTFSSQSWSQQEKVESKYLCDRCKWYREINLVEGKGRRRRTRLAYLCGIAEIRHKYTECKDFLLK